MLNYLKNTQLLIASLIPITLITGPFLADLSIVFIALIFILISVYEKNYSYYKIPLVVCFWIWCIYLIIISIISIDPLLSFESSLLYFRFGLFVLGILYILNTNENFIRYFGYTLMIAFMSLIIDGYFQFITGSNIFGHSYSGGRLSSFFGDKLVLGNYLSRLSPLLFAFIALSFDKSKKYFFLLGMLLLILTDTLIFLAGERTGLFNLFFSTAIILLLSQNWKKIRAITFFIAISIIILISVFNSDVRDRMVDQTLKDFNIPGNLLNESTLEEFEKQDKEINQKIYFFSSRHQAMASISINMFIDKPLTGVGPKIFRKACFLEQYYVGNTSKITSCSTHPHNVFFQLMGETGLLGLIPYIIILGWIFYLFIFQLMFILRIRKNPMISDYQLCLYTALLVTLWPLVPSLNFFNNWISVIYYLPIGFILHSHMTNKKIIIKT